MGISEEEREKREENLKKKCLKTPRM